jgi:putative oxidoreductase
MTLLESPIEPVPSRLGIFTTWLLRVAVALVFLSVGAAKFRDPMWVRLFEQIGLGQWFRYLTGVMQLSAGVLVLIPRASLAGITLAGCTMLGATIAWITVLHAPANAPIPGAILGILIAIGVRDYSRSDVTRRGAR